MGKQIANTFAKKQMENSKKPFRWQIIRDKPYFWGGALVFWVVAGICLLLFPKSKIHLAINEWHTAFGDWLFPKITYLGEAGVYVLMGLIFLYKRQILKFWTMLIAISLHITIVQALKNLIFENEPRPKIFFQDIASLNFVNGVETHSYMSFPSGHTAAAFSAFALIAFFHKHPAWQIMAILAAIAVGFSRMYLQQHFLIDVLVGSWIGTISAFIAFSWFNLQNRKTLQKL